ncbi:MAG: hypothetical protein H7A23_12500 [Leptospiraceae bacterium]|nr:hypothetical protein [Leptospiraceae bacterium]
MSQKKFDGIEHVTHILQKLTNLESLWILADMSLDIQFDKQIRDEIVSKIFNPLDLFKYLEDDEIKLLFTLLPKETISRFFKEDFELRRIFQKYYGKEKLNHFLSVQKKDTWEYASQKTFDCLYRLILEGKIAYNGIPIYLKQPPCVYPVQELHKNHHIFCQIMNPLVHPNEGIKLFVYAPYHSGEIAFLKTNLENKIKIPLDENGFFLGEIFLEKRLGLTEVKISIPNGKEFEKKIYFAPPSRSLYNLSVTNIHHNKNVATIQIGLMYDPNKLRPKNFIRSLIYCSRCGMPITISKTKIQNNKTELTFTVNDHKHDYFLFTYFGENQAACLFSLRQKAQTDFPELEYLERKQNDTIQIEFESFKYSSIFYYVCNSRFQDIKLSNLFSSSNQRVEFLRKHVNLDSKKSPMELSLSKHITILSEPYEFWNWGYFKNLEKTTFEYIPKYNEQAKDLIFQFYKLYSGGFKPILKYISRVSGKPNISPGITNNFKKEEKTKLDKLYLKKVSIEYATPKTVLVQRKADFLPPQNKVINKLLNNQFSHKL